MRGWILRASMPIGVLTFWICMVLSALRFPDEYDWRYMTTSVLIYPERNPAGHGWATAALVSCAGSGLIWLSVMRETLRFHERGILTTGYLCMILSSLLSERWVGIRNGHESLAIVGFISVCCGLVLVSRHTTARQNPDKPSRRIRALLTVIASSPIALAGITQAYLTWWQPQVPWVGLAWRTMHVPLYLSFALWEWITCALLSAYMAGIGLMVREHTCRTSNC